ncbi:MAG: hypothetical protein C4339_00970 [Nitrososphaerota archaeon]
MRVLITGASGFVGRNLMAHLAQRGYELIALDLKEAEVEGDVTDADFVFTRLGELSFDAIIHLAALTNIPQSIEKPYETIKVNAVGTLNVAELAIRKKVTQLIYASTANVYGNPSSVPVDETAPRAPRTPYDYSKCIGEQILEAYARAKGLPVTILRSWKLFGEWDSLGSAVCRFIIRALRGEPLELYNSGRDVSDFTYIANYCRIVELVLERPSSSLRVYNVGTGTPISIKQLAQEIVRLTSSSSRILELPPRHPLEETMVSYPSIEKAKHELGYRPVVDLKEGLNRTIAWIKSLGITG